MIEDEKGTAYVLMVQYRECAEDPPCQYRHQCNVEHKRKTVWKPHTKISLRPGPMHQHLARIAKQVAQYKGTEVLGYTGEVEIFTLDLNRAVPLWGEAERAAYRINGLEAVKQIQKGIAAEQRAREREVKRLAKKALKDRGLLDRPHKRQRVRTSKWSEVKVQ